MNPLNRLQPAAASQPPIGCNFAAPGADPGLLMQGSHPAPQALRTPHPEARAHALAEGTVTGQNGH